MPASSVTASMRLSRRATGSGDIVILRAGDRVPADMRLIETHNLRVEEAILTGESTVVDKITDALEGDLPLGDRVNMVFSGTTVSAGAGVGVVTDTGAQTELGHINQMMAGIEKHRTRCWCRWISSAKRFSPLFSP